MQVKSETHLTPQTIEGEEHKWKNFSLVREPYFHQSSFSPKKIYLFCSLHTFPIFDDFFILYQNFRKDFKSLLVTIFYSKMLLEKHAFWKVEFYSKMSLGI